MMQLAKVKQQAKLMLYHPMRQQPHHTWDPAVVEDDLPEDDAQEVDPMPNTWQTPAQNPNNNKLWQPDDYTDIGRITGV